MPKFSSAEYFGLDEFIKDALRRVEAGKMTADDVHGDILHVLTAYDRGNDSGVVPFMTMRRAEWGNEGP